MRKSREKPPTRRPVYPRPHLFQTRRPRRRAARLIPRTSRREAVALQTIVFFKGLKSATLFVVGLTLFAMVNRDLEKIAHDVAETLHFDVHRRFFEDLFSKLHALAPRQIARAGGGAILYACLLAIEAVGLNRRRAWAAWLAVGLGAALLPIEVYEMIHRPGIRFALAILVNAAVVWYLYREAMRARGPRTRPFAWHTHPHPPSHPVSQGVAP